MISFFEQTKWNTLQQPTRFQQLSLIDKELITSQPPPIQVEYQANKLMDKELITNENFHLPSI